MPINTVSDNSESTKIHRVETIPTIRATQTSLLTQQSYLSFIDTYLGNGSYVFMTINHDAHTTGRMLRKRRKDGFWVKNAKGYLTRVRTGLPGTENTALLDQKMEKVFPLSQGWVFDIRSGKPQTLATERLMEKFFARINQKTFGSKYRLFDQHLRVVGIHENATKKFSRAKANHCHMIVEVPQRTSSIALDTLLFKRTLRWEFDRLVYPLGFEGLMGQSTVLDIRSERIGEKNPHREYILKQLVNWDVAADRVFFPSKARNNTVITRRRPINAD